MSHWSIDLFYVFKVLLFHFYFQSNRINIYTKMSNAMLQRDIASELQFKWNLEDVDVRTKSVERTLAPLVSQVCES
jgi:hypothetical protein